MRTVYRALRNVWRYKSRSFIIIAIVGLSLSIAITMLQANTAASAKSEQLKKEVATLLEIRAPGSAGIEAVIPLNETIVDEVSDIPNVVKVEKYVGDRLVENEKVPPIIMLNGVVPGESLRLATLGQFVPTLIEGRNFKEEDAGQKVVVVGETYAKNHNVSVGGTIVLERLGAKGDWQNVERKAIPPTEMEVIGIFSSGFAFGDNQIFLPFTTAQKLFQKEGQVTDVFLTVDTVENIPKVADELRARYGNSVDLLTLEDQAKTAGESLNQIQATSRMATILALLIGALLILFTALLITKGRTREIGLLKAIGASNADVSKQLMTEIFSLSLLGGVFALAINGLLGSILTNILLGTAAKGTGSWQPTESVVDQGISLGFSPAIVLITLGISIGFGLLGSIYPVIRANRMKPVEALREH
jgi:ABC-type antimicrobial peptide transport system permease subunit